LLAPRPNPNLEDHPVSAVRDCLFSIFAATLLIGCRSSVCTGFWWGNLRVGDHWGDPGVDGRIILGWIFGNWDVGVWTGWS